MRILRLFAASSIAGLTMLASPAMAQDSQSDGTSVGYPTPSPRPPSPQQEEDWARRQREVTLENLINVSCAIGGGIVGFADAALVQVLEAPAVALFPPAEIVAGPAAAAHGIATGAVAAGACVEYLTPSPR